MPTLQDQLQTQLGEDFVIERELGGGGMSRVYVARDRKLDRLVVVKLLRPELAAGVSIDRFRREILLAASLQHPSIVPVLAAGEFEGLPYFLMPFVEGESLRTRLQNGPLSVPESVRILRDVARALSAAHARGIVHRDIKPDNVLLTQDAAVVADFGVAKAFQSARNERQERHDDERTGGKGSGTSHGHSITTVGTSLGTPAYMAPEQVAADPDAGQAVDIYAFGVMAYEMLAGAPPFSGRSPQAIMAAHITEQPTPLDRARPGLPMALSGLVMRCLEKDPSRRPPSAAALVETLEDPAVVSGAFAPITGENNYNGNYNGYTSGANTQPSIVARRRMQPMYVGAALLVIAAIAAGAYMMARRPANTSAVVGATPAASPTPAALPPSVAVLPFVFLGADSTKAWTAKAVADAITNGLSKLPGLRVASQSSADALQRRLAAGDSTALPVRTFVEGVLEREGTRLRLSIRLVDAADGFTLFADRYEGDEGKLFDMEDQIAAAIREMLREHFTLPAPPAGNATARPDSASK